MRCVSIFLLTCLFFYANSVPLLRSETGDQSESAESTTTGSVESTTDEPDNFEDPTFKALDTESIEEQALSSASDEDTEFADDQRNFEESGEGDFTTENLEDDADLDSEFDSNQRKADEQNEEEEDELNDQISFEETEVSSSHKETEGKVTVGNKTVIKGHEEEGHVGFHHTQIDINPKSKENSSENESVTQEPIDNGNTGSTIEPTSDVTQAETEEPVTQQTSSNGDANSTTGPEFDVTHAGTNESVTEQTSGSGSVSSTKKPTSSTSGSNSEGDNDNATKKPNKPWGK